MTKKQPHYREFKEFLFEKLKDPESALAYLNAAFDDEDEQVFLVALKNVLQAQGGDMAVVAEENPNLTYEMIKDILMAQQEVRAEKLPYVFDKK